MYVLLLAVTESTLQKQDFMIMSLQERMKVLDQEKYELATYNKQLQNEAQSRSGKSFSDI